MIKYRRRRPAPSVRVGCSARPRRSSRSRTATATRFTRFNVSVMFEHLYIYSKINLTLTPLSPSRNNSVDSAGIFRESVSALARNKSRAREDKTPADFRGRDRVQAIRLPVKYCFSISIGPDEYERSCSKSNIDRSSQLRSVHVSTRCFFGGFAQYVSTRCVFSHFNIWHSTSSTLLFFGNFRPNTFCPCIWIDFGLIDYRTLKQS